MIVPLVSEEDWLAAIDSLPPWQPIAGKDLLIVAPHPDDETLGAGGLIAQQRCQGVNVSVAAVTNGEKAYPDAPGLAEVRNLEQTKALDRLGVPHEKIFRFGLPDADVAGHEQDLVDRLASLIDNRTHVLAPWTGDFHPDHEACGRAAQEAASRTGATLSFYFFWTWHFGTLATIASLPLRRFLLTPEQLAAKTEALACHRTQLVRAEGEPVLTEILLAPARRPFEIFVTP